MQPTMIRALRLFAIAIALSLLAACGPPVHPINPPSATVQQLEVLPDGRWKVQLRIEIFSDMTMHYASFKASLSIAGSVAADITLTPDIDIPGLNADIVETTFMPAAGASAAFAANAKQPGGAPYELKGTILIPAADKEFKFEHKSRLSAVPGIPNQYR